MAGLIVSLFLSAAASLSPDGATEPVFDHVRIDWAGPKVTLPVRLAMPTPLSISTILIEEARTDTQTALLTTPASAADVQRALILIGAQLPDSPDAPGEALVMELTQPDSGRRFPLSALLDLRQADELQWRFVGMRIAPAEQAPLPPALIAFDPSSNAVVKTDKRTGTISVNLKRLGSMSATMTLQIAPASAVPVVLLLDRFGQTWMRYVPVSDSELRSNLRAERKTRQDLTVRVIYDPLSIESDRQDVLDAVVEAGVPRRAVQMQPGEPRYLLEQVTFPANDPLAAQSLITSKLQSRGELASGFAERSRLLSQQVTEQIQQLQQFIRTTLNRLAIAQDYYRKLTTRPAKQVPQP